MKKYDSYKPSGISWLCEIPSHWEVKKVKYIVDSFQKGKGITKEEVFEDGEVPCVRYGEIYSKYNQSFTECLSSTKNEIINSPSYFHKGDILCAGTGELVEEIGKSIVYLGEKDCIAGGDIIIIKHNLNPSFLNYALNSNYAQLQKSHGKAKLKVVHISASEIGNISLILPSDEEQEKIVEFLSDKTKLIDEQQMHLDKEIQYLQELKQAEIVNAVTKGLNPDMPMKDSGIPWIGQIPEHWSVKYLFQFAKEHFISNKEIHHQNLLSLSYGNIIRKDINKTDGLLPESFDTYQVVEAGNIILRLTDLQNDHKSLRVGLVTEEGIITSAYVCLEIDSAFLPEYFYYFLHMLDLKKIFYSMGGGLRQNLNFNGLRKLEILLPSKEEQKEIVEYIKNRSQAIDDMISNLKSQKDFLTEYKQRLISDAVTGQIDVRDYKSSSSAQ